MTLLYVAYSHIVLTELKILESVMIVYHWIEKDNSLLYLSDLYQFIFFSSIFIIFLDVVYRLFFYLIRLLFLFVDFFFIIICISRTFIRILEIKNYHKEASALHHCESMYLGDKASKRSYSDICLL